MTGRRMCRRDLPMVTCPDLVLLSLRIHTVREQDGGGVSARIVIALHPQWRPQSLTILKGGSTCEYFGQILGPPPDCGRLT